MVDIPTKDYSEFSTPQIKPIYNELKDGQKTNWSHFNTTKTTLAENELVEHFAEHHHEGNKQMAFGVLTLAGFSRLYEFIKKYDYYKIKEAIFNYNMSVMRSNKAPYEFHKFDFNLGISSTNVEMNTNVPTRMVGLISSSAKDVGISKYNFWRTCVCVSPLSYKEFMNGLGNSVKRDIQYIDFAKGIEKSFYEEAISTLKRNKEFLRMLWETKIDESVKYYDIIKENVVDIFDDIKG